MQDAFELQHDYDVYCYLKKTLAPEYDVQAWPNTQYYSEWLFDYEVRKAGATVARLRGDFRDLDPGQLVAQAHAIVAQLRETPTC